MDGRLSRENAQKPESAREGMLSGFFHTGTRSGYFSQADSGRAWPLREAKIRVSWS